MLGRGDVIGELAIDEGAEEERPGRKRDMRSLIDNMELLECGVEGVFDATVVDEPVDRPGSIGASPVFFMEERDGGGGWCRRGAKVALSWELDEAFRGG